MRKIDAFVATLVLGFCSGCSAEMGGGASEVVGHSRQALSDYAADFSETPLVGSSYLSGSRVRALLVRGDRVYVGGSFTIGTLKNLVAFQLPTAPFIAPTLITGFAPNPNSAVWDLASDGDVLYVGGQFTSIGGKTRYRLAAVNANTGVDAGLSADVTGSMSNCPSCGLGTPVDGTAAVQALAVVQTASGSPGKALVVGGNFATIKGVSRPGLGAIELPNGAVSTNRFTAGVAGGFVSTMVWDQAVNNLFVGGTFTSISGAVRNCLAATDPNGSVTGASFDILPGAAGEQPMAQVRELIIDSPDMLIAAVGGKDVEGANKVQTFVASGADQGTSLWRGIRLQGDAQTVELVDGIIYVGFHDGLFTDAGPGSTVPGDPYKVAALDYSTGYPLLDAANVGRRCGIGIGQSPEACWAPEDTSSRFWGVLDLAHYRTPYGLQLFVGGEVREWEGVTNTSLFSTFPIAWTPWLDRDNPSGNGDGEHLSLFQAAGQVCANPAAIECKRISDGVPAHETGENLVCNTTQGLICLNANQSDSYCDDYAVRFLCP